jgi:hypothetical protein
VEGGTTFDYYYFETTLDGHYLYGLVEKGDTTKLGNSYDVDYDPSDGKWHDAGGASPYKYGIDNTGTNLSDFPNEANMQTLYWYNNSGGLTFQFDNPYYVAPSYRYLAFYGEVDSAYNGPTFQEIELTLGTPLNGLSEIKYGVNDTAITFYESKAWEYNGTSYTYNDYSTVMNGDYNFTRPRVQYANVEDVNAIFWYMDMGTGVAIDVNGGTFWTYADGSVAFALGKLYGTNTDPAIFGDASLIENYDFVCDLNRLTAA